MSQQSDRPWLAALAGQFAAASTTWVSTIRGVPLPDGFQPSRACVRGADCYAFIAETATAIQTASRSIPLTTRLDAAALPVPCAWWWFDTPLRLPGMREEDGPVCALSWGLVDNHPKYAHTITQVWVWVINDGDPQHRPCPVYSEVLQQEMTLGDCINLPPPTETPVIQRMSGRDSRALAHALWSFLLAGTVWLQQRIVTVSLGPIERHARKRLAKEANAPVPHDIKVVQLRRTETEPRPPGHVPATVDWSCRWIVDGHWRNQIYANGEHKLIFVMPYVKGPADKPLKVPSHTVYAVTR